MSDDDSTSAESQSVPIRSLSRGISVLQTINRHGSLSMMEIARSSGLPYPTVYRLVQTLIHEGLVECEPARRRYRPTALVQTLAHGFQGDGRLVQAARPYIVQLTRSHGWPITLSTHVGHSMVIRDSTHSISALTFNEYFPGYATPMLESASGLVFVSFMGDEDRATLLEGIRRLPEKRSTQTIELLEEGDLIATIHAQGYATSGYNQFTRNPGKTSSIAVPIFEDGAIAGAISLAFFSSAIKMSAAVDTLADPLLTAGESITQALATPGA